MARDPATDRQRVVAARALSAYNTGTNSSGISITRSNDPMISPELFDLISGVRVAGRKRRFAVMVYISAVALVSAIVAIILHSPFIAAIVILLLSIAAFNALALWTFDAIDGWRFVDYPWVLTAVAVVALSIIKIEFVAKERDVAIIDRSHAAAVKTLRMLDDWQNMCLRESIADWVPLAISSIPGDIAEERAALLDSSFNPCTGTALGDLRYILRNVSMDWPKNLSDEKIKTEISTLTLWEYFCRTVDVLAIPGVPYDSTFSDICDNALTLREGLVGHINLKDMIGSKNAADWVTEEPWRLRWWYFALAFFVGLRLAKVTAEIKQVRMQRRAQTVAARSWGRVPPVIEYTWSADK
jgi:hypothetical protein